MNTSPDEGVGEEQDEVKPKKPAPMVPIQHTGPMAFMELCQRYQIQIVGPGDTAHSQFARIIQQLEEELKKQVDDNEALTNRLARYRRRYGEEIDES